jgi:hypothetical protein
MVARNPPAKSKLIDLALVEQLAERLIVEVGSKRAAHDAIKRANRMAKAGRPEGLRYLQIDRQILWLVEGLRGEWILRGRIVEGPFPLIQKLIELMVDHPNVAKLLGCGSGRLGNSKNAIVKRLLSRKLFHGMFLGNSMADMKAGASFYSPPSEIWEVLDREWPYLQLLPRDRSEKINIPKS